MQRTARKGNATVGQIPLNNEEILHFSLQGLLPVGHTLALNPTLGTLCHIVVNQDRPQMTMEQQFSVSEVSVLLPLLESYPYYCPYDQLLASFTYGKVTDAAIERCREHLQEAMDEGIWDQEMRPMRNVLSRTRFKTRNFHLEISSILETGYILLYGVDRKHTSAS